MSDFLEGKRRNKAEQPDDSKDCGCGFGKACMHKQHHHEAPADFRREYTRQYELRDQVAIRPISHSEVKKIKRDNVSTEALGDVVGPPSDFTEQFNEMARRAKDRHDLMAMGKGLATTAPPPGETEPTQAPWRPLDMTPKDMVVQSYRAEQMRRQLMITARDRGEITQEQYEQFQKDGNIPTGKYEAKMSNGDAEWRKRQQDIRERKLSVLNPEKKRKGGW